MGKTYKEGFSLIRYIVRAGDTLTQIAARFGTSVAAIMEANNLSNPDLIFVGQVLLIPVSGQTPHPPDCPPCPPSPPSPPSPPTPTPPPSTRPEVTRTFDGVQYTLSLNKGVYRLGEQIVIRFKKKNILRVPLTLTYRTSQKVDFRVTRDDRLVWQWSQGRVFTQAITTDRLQPGEEIVYREVWNQRADGIITRPGLYRLTGWNLATPGVRLSVDFRITAQ
ncbi:MAG TPA: LysM peptidoglycan-binding domain-containing protein [Thermoanaerobacterales bacterium]|nr:LysM peptidoglycan-binding domain-containing protein [Thermoanaerobacterales bacterium]